VQGESPDDDEKTRMETHLELRGINATVKVFASYPEAVDALSSGVVDGVCANEIFLNVFGKTGMLILPERFMPEPLCIGVSGTLGAFVQSVDKALMEMKEDGTLSALIDKWKLIDYNMLNDE
jgi:ABC-type amino acid transport substrate-binding protein